VIVLVEPNAVEHLLRPFGDAAIGMTGARVVPLNLPTNWQGFAVQMLWHVHHQLALRSPKLGEMVAFRNILDDFPEDTSTDEPALEALVSAKGYRLAYVAEAIVYNRGPERPEEFLVQRRRVFAGQMRLARRYGYFTSSLRLRHIVPITIEAIRSYPKFFLWTFAAIGVECWARILGLYDCFRNREDVVWRMAKSTKKLEPHVGPLALISVSWPPGALDSMAFLRELRRSDPAGSVFWWDRSQGEILLLVAGESPIEWVERRIRDLTETQAPSLPTTPAAGGEVIVSWVKAGIAERPLVPYRVVKISSQASL
jgi:hypothetical protein